LVEEDIRNSSQFVFYNREEAYELAYLLVMLHTCKHNANLEDKSDFAWFWKGVCEFCPKSMEKMKESELSED
jgi:Sec7-like guanine-nucleotide exchange factor